MRHKDKPSFDGPCRRAFDGPCRRVHAGGLHDRSRVNWEKISTGKRELMKPTRRPSVTLLLETGMLL